MRKVQFTETVLRDANQSLMATRLPYADYADILPTMDKAGYYSIECWGGATFDSCLRYLNEDPWERLRKLRKNLPNNKLQMLLRGQNLLGYKHYHDDVVEKFIELSIKNGIDIIRIFDALNDFRNCETALNATMKYATKNTIASGCICYTQSPVHTVEKYVEMCKELKRMGFQTICLKDMAGTMTPYEAEHLIKGIKDAVGDMPLILHTHSTTGMAYMTLTKAIESGIDVIDTATSCSPAVLLSRPPRPCSMPASSTASRPVWMKSCSTKSTTTSSPSSRSISTTVRSTPRAWEQTHRRWSTRFRAVCCPT